jgi:hypothetical protein
LTASSWFTASLNLYITVFIYLHLSIESMVMFHPVILDLSYLR